MKFELSKKEIKRANKFKKKIEKKYGYNIVEFSYSFTPVGIGILVKISASTGEFKDITDFDIW